MRISRNRTLAVGIAAAAALAVLGTGAGQAQAAGSSKDKSEPAARTAKPGPAPDRAAKIAARSTAGDSVSEDALAKVQGKIARYVDKHGTKYSFGSYVDPSTGKIVLDTNAPAKLIKRLTDTGNQRGLSAVKVKVNKAKTRDAYHRRDDVPSFYGGGGLLASNALCSTGYAVRNSAGSVYMVTAGHCYANGTSVNTESNLRQVGYVTGRALASLGNGPIDMELLYGQSYSGRVFTGGITSSSSAPVVAAGSAAVGYNAYCHSGRTTGEQCGHTATSTTAQVCTTTGCKSPVIAYVGGVVQQGGDSGGAFYAKDANGGIWIRGHVIAGNSSTGYIEPWAQVASRYGVSIVTG